jgi:hypothetical protein
MIDRIRRSRSTGLGVHDQTESVFTIDRNTQTSWSAIESATEAALKMLQDDLFA